MAETNGETAAAARLLKKDETSSAPLQNSNFCMYALLVSVSSVMMSTGIAVGALNALMTGVLQDFYNTTYSDRYGETMNKETWDLNLALTVSMMLAGGFVGALSIRFILACLSRKQSMIVMNMTNIASVLLIVVGGRLIPSYEAMIVGRFIMGLASGFGMNLIPIVVAEICSFSRQPFYLSLIGLNLSFGGVVGLVLGFAKVLGTKELWPYLLSVSALPSLIYLVSSPWLPESPSYLLRNGKRESAFKTLKKLRASPKNEEIDRDLNAIDAFHKSAGAAQQISLSEIFRSKRYVRQLILVIVVFIQAQLCGINGVGMYTNMIFIEAGFQGDQATTASTIVYIVQLVVAFVGSAAIDRFGPKRLNIISSACMAASLFVLTVSWGTVTTVPWMSYVIVAAVSIYVLTWAGGENVALFPMLGAFTNGLNRETFYLFGGGIFWIFSWLVSFITPYFIAWMNFYAFLPFAFLNVFFLGYVLIFIPETRGKTTAEIEKFVQSGQTNFNLRNSKATTTTSEAETLPL
ncbi:solute carrier family 2, facilitated glucose transporter member 1-like [Clavelina lepadiformis]|uniref:Major facilitator superfamily (MFS) profile domain-containing protein n=1 Tax=Clavelina lepadiformis TaxID=159417 RepID=A0ABP0FE64_CLALP